MENEWAREIKNLRDLVIFYRTQAEQAEKIIVQLRRELTYWHEMAMKGGLNG